jgi:hypothetical protein
VVGSTGTTFTAMGNAIFDVYHGDVDVGLVTTPGGSITMRTSDSGSILLNDDLIAEKNVTLHGQDGVIEKGFTLASLNPSVGSTSGTSANWDVLKLTVRAVTGDVTISSNRSAHLRDGDIAIGTIDAGGKIDIHDFNSDPAHQLMDAAIAVHTLKTATSTTVINDNGQVFIGEVTDDNDAQKSFLQIEAGGSTAVPPQVNLDSVDVDEFITIVVHGEGGYVNADSLIARNQQIMVQIDQGDINIGYAQAHDYLELKTVQDGNIFLGQGVSETGNIYLETLGKGNITTGEWTLNGVHSENTSGNPDLQAAGNIYLSTGGNIAPAYENEAIVVPNPPDSGIGNIVVDHSVVAGKDLDIRIFGTGNLGDPQAKTAYGDFKSEMGNINVDVHKGGINVNSMYAVSASPYLVYPEHPAEESDNSDNIHNVNIATHSSDFSFVNDIEAGDPAYVIDPNSVNWDLRFVAPKYGNIYFINDFEPTPGASGGAKVGEGSIAINQAIAENDLNFKTLSGNIYLGMDKSDSSSTVKTQNGNMNYTSPNGIVESYSQVLSGYDLVTQAAGVKAHSAQWANRNYVLFVNRDGAYFSSVQGAHGGIEIAASSVGSLCFGSGCAGVTDDSKNFALQAYKGILITTEKGDITATDPINSDKSFVYLKSTEGGDINVADVTSTGVNLEGKSANYDPLGYIWASDQDPTSAAMKDGILSGAIWIVTNDGNINARNVESGATNVQMLTGNGNIEFNDVKGGACSPDAVASGACQTETAISGQGNVTIAVGDITSLSNINRDPLASSSASTVLGEGDIHGHDVVSTATATFKTSNGDIVLASVTGNHVNFTLASKGTELNVTDGINIDETHRGQVLQAGIQANEAPSTVVDEPELVARGDKITFQKITHQIAEGDQDYLTIVLNGSEGAMDTVTIGDIDTPYGVEINGLWTNKAYIHTSQPNFRILDAYAITAAYLSNDTTKMALFGKAPLDEDWWEPQFPQSSQGSLAPMEPKWVKSKEKSDIQSYYNPGKNHHLARISFQNEFAEDGIENYQIVHDYPNPLFKVPDDQWSLMQEVAAIIDRNEKTAEQGEAYSWTLMVPPSLVTNILLPKYPAVNWKWQTTSLDEGHTDYELFFTNEFMQSDLFFEKEPNNYELKKK